MSAKIDIGQMGTGREVSKLHRRIENAAPTIERWLREQWETHAAPFYASVDLRDGGYKVAPVDINLFPGGFNNLDPASDAQCLPAILATIERVRPGARSVLLVPENHTRNTGYIENVIALQAMLTRAGAEVRVASVDPGLTATTFIEGKNGTLKLEPAKRIGNRLGVEGFDPAMVLLNNDLSGGVPELLRNLEQPVMPPPYAGWTTRRKSNHFAIYHDLARQICAQIGIDPWFIDPCFARCGEVDFHESTGQQCLADQVDGLLTKIRAKYKEHGIGREPFIIVKADAGTYGMAVMTVKDPSEVWHLNRKQRKKMEMAKGHAEVHEVMIQEGVYTADIVEASTAEPVIYMVDRFVVGGYYRVSPGRTQDENLNVPGAYFVTAAFDHSCAVADSKNLQSPNHFHIYGLVARIALVATAIEIEQAAKSIAHDKAGALSNIDGLPKTAE